MIEFCKMPEEMALEILSRLPPKCLMRFKCVHKSWYTLINNPSFVAKHLANGMHNNSSTCLLLKRLIVKDTDAQETETVFSLLNIGNVKDDSEHDLPCVLEDMMKGQFIELKVLESAWIVGHCDGIICLADASNVMVLLNPAIMEFKLITPEQNVPDKRLNIGFGYDPKSKNYKVVDVFPLDVETYGKENIIYNPPTIKVYTSATDSWREVMTDSLESETTNFCLDSFQIYFKGFCYWTGREQLKEYTSDEYDYDGGNIRQVIISFDMGDEVFQNILVPDSLYEECFSWYDIHLMVWNESIALLSLDGDMTQPETLGMWVMAEFGGVECSWIKQFTFGKALGIVTLLQFRKSHEILMFSEEEHLVSYNLDTEKLNHLPIDGLDSDDLRAVAYVTSIVGIGGSNILRSRDSSDNKDLSKEVKDKKAKIRAKMTFCKLPEEMAMQILSRLSPQSLMRFKCIHKSWYTMINNPKFIAKHLSNSMHNNFSTCILFKRSVFNNKNTGDNDEKETVFSMLTLSYDDDDHKEHIIHYVGDDIVKSHFVGLKAKDLESVWIIGHCDGIICLADSSNVILWNPAIMEFRLLSLEPYPDQVMNSLGFGYDPKSTEYKVVNIANPGEEEYGAEDDCHLLFNPPKVQVYTLSTDSWREIKTDSLETETTNIWPEYFQLYFKGFCYWRGREQLKEFANFYDRNEEEYVRQLIISFDTVDEEFHHILFPDSLYESYVCWYSMNVIVWNEAVALFGVDHGIFSDYSWGLWVMDDFGGVLKGSWIKQFTFGKAAGIEKPLQFWKMDEIFMVSEDGRIVSYNLDTEELKYLPINDMNSDHFEVVVYVKSIITISGSRIC